MEVLKTQNRRGAVRGLCHSMCGTVLSIELNRREYQWYYTDQPTSVRKGEELDKKRVAAFLSDAIPGLGGDLSSEDFPKDTAILPTC